MNKNRLISFSLALMISYILIPTMAGAEEYEVTVADCDINNDCIVDDLDCSLIQEVYGDYCEPGELPQDVDHDGRVFLGDLSWVVSYMNQTVPDCTQNQTSDATITATDLDFNGDCVVNQDDLDLLNEVYGQYCEPGELPQDLNNNGRVFLGDSVLFTNYYSEYEGEIQNCPPEDVGPIVEEWDISFYSVPDMHAVVVSEVSGNISWDDVNITCDYAFAKHFDNEMVQLSNAIIVTGGTITIKYPANNATNCTEYKEFETTFTVSEPEPEVNETIPEPDPEVNETIPEPDPEVNETIPEPDPEVNETEQINETVDSIEKQIENLQENISKLEAEKEHVILLRDCFNRSINRWKGVMNNFMIGHAYQKIEKLFNAKINALDNEISTLNGEILQLLSEQAETFIPQ
jgi:hypothetical protein